MTKWIKPSELPKDTCGLHWTSYKTSDGGWSNPSMEYIENYRGDWYVGEDGWQSEMNDWSWRILLIEQPEMPRE